MLKDVVVPDLGNFQEVPVIEILVKPGDEVAAETSLLTLETDKATLEIPAPFKGTVREILVKVGDKVRVAQRIFKLEVEDATLEVPSPSKPVLEPAPQPPASSTIPPTAVPIETASRQTLYAGPGVRRMAREMGLALDTIQGTGLKGRITKTDLYQTVKQQLASGTGAGASPMSDFKFPPLLPVDFGQWGPVEKQPLARIKKISGGYLHRNWVMAPHVTQFEEADITELEQFRKKEQKTLDLRLTPLAFIIQAVVATLRQFPHFNASLSPDGQELILKKYYHIGVAVDTPNGLVVPIVRNADQKGALALAEEVGLLAQKARQGQLMASEMQGGTFSISSLGGIAGTAFTPIINLPEVAILGVSRAQIRPVYDEETHSWLPRLLLPLSLSYDHRVIDGAEGARFTAKLRQHLSDLKTCLL